MFNLVVKEEADVDILESYVWCEGQKPGLGGSFLEEIEEYFELLRKNPDSFQVKHKKTSRLAPLKRFPFVIVYRTEGPDVVAFAIYHTSRDPKKWKKRR